MFQIRCEIELQKSGGSEIIFQSEPIADIYPCVPNQKAQGIDGSLHKMQEAPGNDNFIHSQYSF